MGAIRQTALGTAKISALLLLALSALHSAVVQAQQYTLTAIPSLNGQTASFATGLNDAGQVVGYAGSVAWLWDGNTVTNLDPGQGFSSAQGINAAGQVAGWSTIQGGSFIHATLWNGTTPTNLGSLGTADDILSQANAIND